jgi:hypothetical protein
MIVRITEYDQYVKRELISLRLSCRGLRKGINNLRELKPYLNTDKPKVIKEYEGMSIAEKRFISATNNLNAVGFSPNRMFDIQNRLLSEVDGNYKKKQIKAHSLHEKVARKK